MLTPAAEGTVVWDDGAGPSTLALPANTTSFVLGLLRPSTTVDLTFTDAAGANLTATFETGPARIALTFDVVGSLDVPVLAFPFGCADQQSRLVLASPDGVVLGDLDLAALHPTSGVRPIRGLRADGTDRLLAIVGNETLAEVDPVRGTSVATRPGTVVHHDVVRHDGLLWALTAEVLTFGGTDWVMDGLVAVPSGGVPERTWSLADVFTPTGSAPPSGYWADTFDAPDYAHANSLAFDPSGRPILSLHRHDAILRLTPDLDADLLVVGSPASDLAPGDVTLTGVVDPTFGSQHHVTAASDDEWWMFDNEGVDEGARALRLDFDGASAVAGDVRPTGRVCPGQGSVDVLDDGTVLADCSAQATFIAMDAAGIETWSMAVGCATGSPSDATVYRVVPLWPDRAVVP